MLTRELTQVRHVDVSMMVIISARVRVRLADVLEKLRTQSHAPANSTTQDGEHTQSGGYK